MNIEKLDNAAVPYFAWDRHLTTGAIKDIIKSDSGFEWYRIVSWIMREAAFVDVWQFLTPVQVRDSFAELEPMLGRKKEFWRYIIRKWNELGKF